MALTPAVFSAGPLLETRFFPVQRNIHVTVQGADRSGVLLHVQFEKVRFCEFVELIWFDGDVQLDVEYRPDLAPHVRPRTRLPGEHSAGPWRVDGVARLEGTRAFALHRCHPLWLTISNFYGQ